MFDDSEVERLRARLTITAFLAWLTLHLETERGFRHDTAALERSTNCDGGKLVRVRVFRDRD